MDGWRHMRVGVMENGGGRKEGKGVGKGLAFWSRGKTEVKNGLYISVDGAIYSLLIRMPCHARSSIYFDCVISRSRIVYR